MPKKKPWKEDPVKEKNFDKYYDLFMLTKTSAEEYEKVKLPQNLVDQVRNLRTKIRHEYGYVADEIDYFNNDEKDQELIHNNFDLKEKISPYLDKLTEMRIIEAQRIRNMTQTEKKRQAQAEAAENEFAFQEMIRRFRELRKLAMKEEEEPGSYKSYSLSIEDQGKMKDLFEALTIYDELDLDNINEVMLTLQTESEESDDEFEAGSTTFNNIVEDYYYLAEAVLRPRPKPRPASAKKKSHKEPNMVLQPRPPASAETKKALALIRKHDEEDFTKYTKVVQSIIKKVLTVHTFEINEKQTKQLKAAFVKCNAGKTYDIKKEVNGRCYIIIDNSVRLVKNKKDGKEHHLKVYIS